MGSARACRFFLMYCHYVFSQKWLWLSGRDIEQLATIPNLLPSTCRVRAVTLEYAPWKLHANVTAYGRGAPEHPFELALYCTQTFSGVREAENFLVSTRYARHVEWVVRRTEESRDLTNAASVEHKTDPAPVATTEREEMGY